MGQIKREVGMCLTSEMTSFTERSIKCYVLDIDRFKDKDIKMGLIKYSCNIHPSCPIEISAPRGPRGGGGGQKIRLKKL